MIFGRKGCDEDRDWKVKVYFMGRDDYLTIIEQVNKKEAMKVFDTLKLEMKTKNPIIEISTKGNKQWFLNKSHIQSVKIYRY